MRLIDADEFKKQIAGMAIANNYPVDRANKFCELIDNQPAVYDMDKVVERLESILEGVNIQLELSKDFQPKESESVKNNIVFFTEKKRLCEEFIKIVKSGGIV